MNNTIRITARLFFGIMQEKDDAIDKTKALVHFHSNNKKIAIELSELYLESRMSPDMFMLCAGLTPISDTVYFMEIGTDEETLIEFHNNLKNIKK